MKNVLILGAGSVSGPCIDYLARKGNCGIVVSDISQDNLDVVAKNFPTVKVARKDVSKDAGALMDEFKPDLVLNLMPPALMPMVGKLCFERRIHQVHPAYLDQETREMQNACADAGLIFVAELGLDPGIDHMSAASTIEKIHEAGGCVQSYTSNCGALPAADANTNPWGYKLSWSPSSLIGASKRSARILKGGKEISWPDGETYEYTELYEVPGLGTFEIYANGDSVPYRAFYGIPEAHSIYRGTIRYVGWGETICHMNAIKFFDTDEQNTSGLTFAQFTARQAGAAGKPPREALIEKLGLKKWSTFLLRMEWLGFFDDRPTPFERGSARDVVSFLFAEKLVYTPEERDLVVLVDEVEYTDKGGKKKVHKSTLIDFGIPGKWSAIARTTGVPPAIAARFILDGTIARPGVHVPTIPEVYNPVLAELKNENIALGEATFDAA